MEFLLEGFSFMSPEHSILVLAPCSSSTSHSSPERGSLTLSLARNVPCLLHYVRRGALVDNETEAADLVLFAQVGPMLAVLVKPLGRHNDLEHIMHH